MPNVLLTTVYRPFGGKGEGDSVEAELFHAQVTRSQGIFSYRQVIRCWGLDYIAENIEAPTVVLHYPSKREFHREIQKRRQRRAEARQFLEDIVKEFCSLSFKKRLEC